jgi:glycosyltransferase involved in cell wall biosynthesis
MKILFVNHTGAASGAEFALLRLVGAVRRRHHSAVACPPGGALADMLDDAAIEHLPLPAFEPSLRLHPVHTPLAMVGLAAGSLALARASRRCGADLIHANTPRAGLMAAGARRAGGPPFVVRAHEHTPLNAVGRGVRFALTHSASAILTVSRENARRFNEGLDRPVATCVYNSFDRERFNPKTVHGSDIRQELGIEREAALLGQVAQITPWKGQDTSIRALWALQRSGVNAHLLIVGGIAFSAKGVRYDNRAYLESLHGLVRELELEERVHFLGRRGDVPAILSELDVSLLPSWDEPFANVMLESMAMGTPMFVSNVGGGPELVEDGVSGRTLPPKRPEQWASAVEEALNNPAMLAGMSVRARAATANFSDELHARDMLDVYEHVLSRPERDPGAVAAEIPSRRIATSEPTRRFVRGDETSGNRQDPDPSPVA